MDNSKIEVDAGTIRATINAIWSLLKDPSNKAAQTLAKAAATTLEEYLPETLDAYRLSSSPKKIPDKFFLKDSSIPKKNLDTDTYFNKFRIDPKGSK
jgi:hypothetical protein